MAAQSGKRGGAFGHGVRFAVVGLSAAAFGACLWVYAPVFTGANEAFDSPLYPVYLFVGGACFAAVCGRHGWVVAFAMLGGQLLGFWQTVAQDPRAALWPLGVVFIAQYSVIALAGALVPSLLRLLRKRKADGRR